MEFPLISQRLSIAKSLATRAGTLLLQSQHSEKEVRTKSCETDLVTEVDLAAEKLVVDGIFRSFPDDGIISEEGAARESSSRFTWIVDPLDGTANYVRELRSSAVSIAIAFDEVVVAGVVHDPYSGELFEAVVGNGAFCNGTSMFSDTSSELRLSFVGLSGSNRFGPRHLRAELASRFAMQANSVRDIGSTALSLCWTAAGRIDAHIGIDVQWWDIAAGVIIAIEAGCVAVGFDDETEPTPAGFVVSRSTNLADIAKVLTDVGISIHVTEDGD